MCSVTTLPSPPYHLYKPQYFCLIVAQTSPLIGRPYILQSKRHHFVVVISSRSNKNCLLLIIQSQWYLVVSLEGIQKAHPRMAYSCIHQLVHPRHGKRVFWTGLIQICEVYTYSPLSILLLHHYSIGQPVRVKHLFNSLSLLMFDYLVLDSIKIVFR